MNQRPFLIAIVAGTTIFAVGAMAMFGCMIIGVNAGFHGPAHELVTPAALFALSGAGITILSVLIMLWKTVLSQ